MRQLPLIARWSSCGSYKADTIRRRTVLPISNCEVTDIPVIPVDFFGCKREEIASCSWGEACDRFPCAGLTIPDASALISMSEVLTGSGTSPVESVSLSAEPLYELADRLTAAVRDATADDLMDAGARWAQLSPWKQLDTNSMDLAGFLLELKSLVHGSGKEENSIFLLVESGELLSS